MVRSEATSTFDPGGAVLVGVDWTAGSQHALDWAATLSRRTDSHLDLLHASSPWVGLEMAVPPFDGGLYRAAVEDAMNEWSARVSDVDHDVIITENDAADAILLEADERGSELIALGAHGKRAWTPHLLGSVASKVLHSTSPPVAVVPEAAPADATGGRVVAGVDGSATSLRALRWAASYARALDMRPYAVCVVPFEPYAEQPRLAEFDSVDPMGDTLTALRTLAAQVENEIGTEISSDVLVGHAASQLVKAVQPGDVLVVGATGHGPLAAAILGSTSRTCATHSDVPTVVVP